VGDDYTITLNSDYIPQLRISNTYKDIVSAEGKARDVKSYIRDKIRSGKFLIKSIHQRQETIHRIAEEIVVRQKDFLDHGPSQLHPMNMSQIAEIVGVHETTVSRAISGKYMQTPRGVYEMRYFFTTGYKTESGEDMSNTSVKEAIAEMVENEDPRKPLSDAKIEKMLNEKGIPVARRTIAKYRNELGILSSSMRRKY
jgi:RNA polymerase sigma-54 factor